MINDQKPKALNRFNERNKDRQTERKIVCLFVCENCLKGTVQHLAILSNDDDCILHL